MGIIKTACVNKYYWYTLYAGTDAFKCIAQRKSTGVWHDNRAKVKEQRYRNDNKLNCLTVIKILFSPWYTDT